MKPFRTSIECVCLPDLGYKCNTCRKKESPEEVEKELRRQGYGYFLADQDGHDGGEVSAIDHKDEEFFEAAKEILKTKPI